MIIALFQWTEWNFSITRQQPASRWRAAQLRMHNKILVTPAKTAFYIFSWKFPQTGNNTAKSGMRTQMRSHSDSNEESISLIMRTQTRSQWTSWRLKRGVNEVKRNEVKRGVNEPYGDSTKSQWALWLKRGVNQRNQWFMRTQTRSQIQTGVNEDQTRSMSFMRTQTRSQWALIIMAQTGVNEDHRDEVDFQNELYKEFPDELSRFQISRFLNFQFPKI